MERFEERTKELTHLTYRAIGSGPGQRDFIGADNNNTSYTHFGAGDIPMSKEDYTTLVEKGGMIHLPFVLGAISVFHSIPGIPNGVGGLNLTACELAQIFNREITSWDDEKITKLNPNLDVPAGFPIHVARRVEGSSSTSTLTKYMNSKCPDHWPEEMTGKKITWPDGTMECDSSSLMAKCIRDNPGAIGYSDAGHGHAEGLIEIELENEDGTFLSSRFAMENEGIADAASSFPMNDKDYSEMNVMNQPGKYTWPMVAASYLYVRKDLSYIKNSEEQGLLIGFLKSVFNSEYNSACADFGFVFVKDSVIDQNLDAITNLTVNDDAPTFVFESGNDKADVAGGDDYVVSGKRRTYAEYERESTSVKISDLETTLAAQETTIAMLEKELNDLKSDSASSEAMTALGLSIASSVLWGLLLGWVFFFRKRLVHKDVDDGSLVSDINLQEGVTHTNGHV